MLDISYKRIVIKVGTSTLTYDNGKLNLHRMEKLARVISDIRNYGVQVVLVSSGAVAAGAAKVNLEHRPTTLVEKQAMAAVGQTELMRMYDRFFSGYGHQVAQILLTKSVMEKDTELSRKSDYKNEVHRLRQQGLKQREIALRLGISQSLVSKLLND